MTTFTLPGSTGNDTLQSPSTVATLVQGFQGNDTITLLKADDAAQAGAGADFIRVTAALQSQTITAGSGHDTIQIDGNNVVSASFAGDLGADSIATTVTGGNINSTSIFGGKGADTLQLSQAITNSIAYMGADADSINLLSATIGSSTFRAGSQADTIHIGSAISSADINGNKGADVISALSLSAGSIFGGAGNDTIDVVLMLTGHVNAGAGADTLDITGTGTVVGGAGADSITASSTSGGSFSLDGFNVDSSGTGSGNLADGADIFSAATGIVSATVLGAGGSDTITLQALGTGQTFEINGGDLGDSITVGASISGGSNLTVAGGKGADTITLGVGATANSVSVVAGAGHDLISAGLFMGTMVAGAGLDTVVLDSLQTGSLINLGAQADFLTLTGAVGASGTIQGGTGADTIDVVGAVGQGTLRAVELGNGNDLITFNTAAIGAMSAAGTSLANNVTIYGGDGVDTIKIGNGGLLSGIGHAYSGASGVGSAAVLNSLFVGDLDSGDQIVMTSLITNTGNANWFGNAGQVFVLADTTNLTAAFLTAVSAQGSVAVWQNGDDTDFFIQVTSVSAINFRVKGQDLVNVTTTGLANFTTANFGFTLANTGTNVGLNITIS